MKKEQHHLKTISTQKKNKANPFQDLYDTFLRNCSNLRRKFGDNSTAREKYNTKFQKIRTKALKTKKGLCDDSPKQSIYEFLEFIRIGMSLWDWQLS